MKHLLRMGIVVVFALAVAVLSAAAQDTPADVGESGFPAATLAESEPNNTLERADLISMGDVMAGAIDGRYDVDYYRLDPPDNPYWVGEGMARMIDIDAQALASPLDASLCLYATIDRGTMEMACNDDSEGYDPLLLYKLYPTGTEPGPPYYIRVQHADYPNYGGPDYTYTLSVYRPLLISAATNGTVAGISFTRSDVLSHYDFPDGTEKWLLFFDASDVGITRNVVGLAAGHWGADIELALERSQPLTVAGAVETVTPFDLLYFEPGPDGRYGPKTAGSFPGWNWGRGSDLGLSAGGEKIDAIVWGALISTTGVARFPSGLTTQDEDLVSAWNGGWLHFDGSRVPGLAAEDVVAADSVRREQWDDAYLLTILGGGVIDGWRFSQKDIFSVDPVYYGVTGLYWHGPDHHFDYPIDAFDAAD